MATHSEELIGKGVWQTSVGVVWECIPAELGQTVASGRTRKGPGLHISNGIESGHFCIVA